MNPKVYPRFPHWLPHPLRKGWILSRRINKLVRSCLSKSEVEELMRVDGHLLLQGGAILFYFAFNPVCEGHVVEIGSFKGKSAAWMAKALKLGNIDDRVVAIDPHINTGDLFDVPAYEEKNSYDEFLENLSRLDLSPFVEPVRATSEEASKDWDRKIRLLFIDGAHRYEDVMLDLKLWEPSVSTGGIICLHDTNAGGQFPGVRQAMNEYLEASSRFEKLLELRAMSIYKKLDLGKPKT